MKLSAQEEYGLRCLLHMARQPEGASATIPEISRAEGLSIPNVAKLMRILRMSGFVASARGQTGGYKLARPSNRITVGEVLASLGGTLFSPGFCSRHAGVQESCAHDADCSLRSIWSALHNLVQDVLGKTTLRDLLCSEGEMREALAVHGNGLYQVATAASAAAHTSSSGAD
jgi:Rrf2 family protein